MSDIVIQAENLGKKYTIGYQTERGRYVARRDVNAKAQRRKGAKLSIFSILYSPFSILPSPFSIGRGLGAQGRELRDPARGNGGRTAGIIGRNGAGKSTVLRRRNTWLKILSRITEPSAGRVTIKGRVASLLETCPEQGRRGGHGLSPRADRAGEHLRKRCYTWDEVKQGGGH